MHDAKVRSAAARTSAVLGAWLVAGAAFVGCGDEGKAGSTGCESGCADGSVHAGGRTGSTGGQGSGMGSGGGGTSTGGAGTGTGGTGAGGGAGHDGGAGGAHDAGAGGAHDAGAGGVRDAGPDAEPEGGAVDACPNGSCTAGCDGATPITTTTARVPGTLSGASDQAMLPCGEAGRPERLFTFTAPESATYVIGTPGTETVLAVLDGCGGTALTCEREAARYSSTVTLDAGRLVTIAVEASAAAAGPFELRVQKAATDPCCEERGSPGCGDGAIEACVCAVASGCCTDEWSATCNALINTLGCGFCQVDRPPSCGPTECPRFEATAAFLGVGQCCTTENECGAFFGGRCIERDQGGSRDTACPTEQAAGVRAAGCCRSDGRCGIDLSSLDMGCVARETAPGVSLSAIACGTASTLPDFTNFEVDQVRPLALSPDGSRLFAVNTPDARLEVFTVDTGGLTHSGSIPVGMGPVAVAARTNTEAWVVNELSDSISIVDLAASPPRVIRTLWVGDEPRDLVFGGPGGALAFVTTAHRGQNHPVDAELLTPGVGRADVWVFDTDALGPEPGGAPATIVNLFGDTPRALAVSPDGTTVYAAVYHSGSRTTVLNEQAVAGQLPPPTATVDGLPQPSVSLILKFDGTNWVDETGRAWDDRVRFSLPDYDVFEIDASTRTPVAARRFPGVGTTLFNLAVNPQSGAVYVTNTDAHNEVRFETEIQGRFLDTRVTVISGSQVTPRVLNTHLDLGAAGSIAERNLSIGIPTGMAVSADGATLYVAALGTGEVAVVDTAALEGGSFVPSAGAQIRVTGGGPTGLVLDEGAGRLYVLTRFDNGVSVLDVNTRTEVGHVRMPNPEPFEVVDGRPVFYETTGASAHGDLSCASCHIFGDTDHLAWDLGNPTGVDVGGFHPMKGPMATQSLRGMAGHGPLHWRGDRSGAFDPGGNSQDTPAAFRQFNGAFVSLLGRQSQLTAADMTRFTDFIMTVTYPPNPIRALDDSLTPSQQAGLNTYRNRNSDIISTCNGCHLLDVESGHFGSDGNNHFDAEPQNFKAPHLRNAYQKVGMFGMSSGLGIPETGFLGDQIRGFGYLHDGSIATLPDFLQASIFSLTPDDERQLAEFMLAFDSNVAPIVGQQVTLHAGSATSARPRLALLAQQAIVTVPRRACDLVGHGVVGGEARGFLMRGDGTFSSDRAAEAPRTINDLFALVQDPATRVTFTCVPPGSGMRAGLDRDRDGKLDRDEIDAGTDPADPGS